MNRFILVIVLVALSLALALRGEAQGVFGNRVEGSRPGETFREGEPTPDRVQQQDAVQPRQQDQDSAAEIRRQDPAMQQNPPADPRERAAAAQTSARALPAGTPVIMEFSDLQCPDSARYNAELKTTVMQRYVSSGRASYQWHDFPLPNHEQAVEAAAAARCAGQSADRLRRQIMANQAHMSSNVYESYARQAGVDPEQFSACLRNDTTVDEVKRDKQLGQSMGVRGTPSLVLGVADGRGHVQPMKVVKAYEPPQQVLAEIDSFLANAARPNPAGQQTAPQSQPAQYGWPAQPVQQ